MSGPRMLWMDRYRRLARCVGQVGKDDFQVTPRSQPGAADPGPYQGSFGPAVGAEPSPYRDSFGGPAAADPCPGAVTPEPDPSEWRLYTVGFHFRPDRTEHLVGFIALSPEAAIERALDAFDDIADLRIVEAV